MPRPGGAFAAGCIAILAFSALVPGLAALQCALVDPVWVLVPGFTPLAMCVAGAPADEQPRPLLSILPSRAPPVPPLA